MAFEKEVIKVEKEEIKVPLLKCSICDKEFDRFSSLEVHLLAFHQIFFKGENVIFFWIMCPITYLDALSKREHSIQSNIFWITYPTR